MTGTDILGQRVKAVSVDHRRQIVEIMTYEGGLYQFAFVDGHVRTAALTPICPEIPLPRIAPRETEAL